MVADRPDDRFSTMSTEDGIVAAHVLTAVRRPDIVDLTETHRDIVAILTALEGHRGATFTIQWMCDPRVDDPHGGVIQIAVLTCAPLGLPASVIDELVDDVGDLLNGPPHLWQFEAVGDPESLRNLVTPVAAHYVASIGRREEELPELEGWSAGFTSAASTARPVPQLWNLWTLGPPAADTDRLTSVLLAQEAPVCVRMTLSPATMTEGERDRLEEVVVETSPVAQESATYRAAHRTLESFLYLRPLFEGRCLVASPEPLSPALISTVGHSLSEPTQHVAPPPPALSGGYATHRVEMKGAFESLRMREELPSLSPPELHRLRGLFGVWEAANLFRLPVVGPREPQGLPFSESPALPGVLRDLPTRGTHIGSLPAMPTRSVAIETTDRMRHAYVVGQTGTGKSTLLMNMALDDILAGHGVCVIDPHGDLIQLLLERIPADRHDDVVVVDPADPEAVVGVNLIEAETSVQQNYLVSELSNMFYALFDPTRQGIVGPRFETMLRQTVLLLQQGDVPASFLDVPTVFTDPAVRKHLTDQIDDPLLAEYWRGEIVQNRSNEWGEVVSWFRSKFEVFRTSPLLRRVVGQARSSVSFSEVLDEQKILLVNLAKGSLGEYNSSLLGHVIVMKLWGAILERALRPEAERSEFFVYIDEFQNFTTDSLDTMLAEARKYGVGLTLANQFFGQLRPTTRAALLGNVGSKLAFRLGPADAAEFTQWLGDEVAASELVNLPNHQLIAALSPSGLPTAPVLLHSRPAPPGSPSASEVACSVSREAFGTPVFEIDRDITNRWAVVAGSITALLRKQEESVAERRTEDSNRESWRAMVREFSSRRWTWLDEWLDSQLRVHPDTGTRIVRCTITSAETVDWGQLAARLSECDPERQLTPEQLAGAFTKSDAVLAGSRWWTGRLALELWAVGMGADTHISYGVVGEPPPGVQLKHLGIHPIVVRHLNTRGVLTLDDLRQAQPGLLESLGLAHELVDEARQWQHGSPTPGESAAGDLSTALSAAIPPELWSDLRQALVEEAARRAAGDALTKTDDDGEPSLDQTLPFALAHHMSRLTWDVRQRLAQIVELLG